MNLLQRYIDRKHDVPSEVNTPLHIIYRYSILHVHVLLVIHALIINKLYIIITLN